MVLRTLAWTRVVRRSTSEPVGCPTGSSPKVSVAALHRDLPLREEIDDERQRDTGDPARLDTGPAVACATEQGSDGDSSEQDVVAVEPSDRLIATRLFGGNSSTCAILADGDVRCWGSNSFGEAGTYVPRPFSQRTVSISSTSVSRVPDGKLLLVSPSAWTPSS